MEVFIKMFEGYEYSPVFLYIIIILFGLIRKFDFKVP